MRSQRATNKRRCFTLIELLVVVSVIALLAVIALDNFLAAQIRAKTARIHSDFRTMATAIEAYRVDWNRPPRMAHFPIYQDPAFDIIEGIPVSGVLSRSLSTPVAYLVSSVLFDPFLYGNPALPMDERLYTYQHIPTYIDRNPESTFWPAALEFYGDWRLASAGPDLTFDHGFANSAQLPYDPTNGIVSLGNIWYGQRGDPPMPHVPSLLGVH